MDKTVQTYLNEYISLIGKGKFMLFGGNNFLNAGVPKVADIEAAIEYYTMVNASVNPTTDVFDRILKPKAEFEKKKTDGTTEVEKGKATDEQYAVFVTEWKGIQKDLVPALLAEFDRLEGVAKGVGSSGKPGLFGGVFTSDGALRAAAKMAGVVAKTEDVVSFIMELIENVDEDKVKLPKIQSLIATYDDSTFVNLVKIEYNKSKNPDKKNNCSDVAQLLWSLYNEKITTDEQKTIDRLPDIWDQVFNEVPN
jgi:hypothetical protein